MRKGLSKSVGRFTGTLPPLGVIGERQSDLVSRHLVDLLRQLLYLAFFATLGDRHRVRHPSAAAILKHVFLRVFQQGERLPVGFGRLTRWNLERGTLRLGGAVRS